MGEVLGTREPAECAQASRGERRSSGHRRDDGGRTLSVSERAVAGDQSEPRLGRVPTESGTASRDREAGRRGKAVRDTDGGRPLHPASGPAGDDAGVGAGVFTTQLRVSAWTRGTRSCQGSTGVCSRRIRLGGGYRPGQVIRPSEPRQADGASGAGGERRAGAGADTEVLGVWGDGQRGGDGHGGRDAARWATVAVASQHHFGRPGQRVGEARAPVRTLRRRLQHLREKQTGGRAGEAEHSAVSGREVEPESQ